MDEKTKTIVSNFLTDIEQKASELIKEIDSFYEVNRNDPDFADVFRKKYLDKSLKFLSAHTSTFSAALLGNEEAMNECGKGSETIAKSVINRYHFLGGLPR